MIQEVETKTTYTDEALHVSAEAAQAVKNILAERKLDGYALRIYVSGSGCSGVQFGMALDNNIRASDSSFQAEGIQVVVDEMSIEYLRGAKVDFVNDPQRGAGFVVDSPLASQGGGCSCGSKSEGHSQAEGNSCGCGGGSCGCGGH
jgi:iron-sulfur cluster assembly accessory protein